MSDTDPEVDPPVHIDGDDEPHEHTSDDPTDDGEMGDDDGVIDPD